MAPKASRRNELNVLLRRMDEAWPESLGVQPSISTLPPLASRDSPPHRCSETLASDLALPTLPSASITSGANLVPSRSTPQSARARELEDLSERLRAALELCLPGHVQSLPPAGLEVARIEDVQDAVSDEDTVIPDSEPDRLAAFEIHDRMVSKLPSPETRTSIEQEAVKNGFREESVSSCLSILSTDVLHGSPEPGREVLNREGRQWKITFLFRDLFFGRRHYGPAYKNKFVLTPTCLVFPCNEYPGNPDAQMTVPLQEVEHAWGDDEHGMVMLRTKVAPCVESAPGAADSIWTAPTRIFTLDMCTHKAGVRVFKEAMLQYAQSPEG